MEYNIYNYLYKINKYKLKLKENPGNEIYNNKIIYYTNLIGGKQKYSTIDENISKDFSQIEYYTKYNKNKNYGKIYYPFVNKKFIVKDKKYKLKDIYSFINISNFDYVFINIDNKINSIITNIQIFTNYIINYNNQKTIVCKNCKQNNNNCIEAIPLYHYCKTNNIDNEIIIKIINKIRKNLKNKDLFIKNFFYEYIIDKDKYIDNVIIKKILLYFTYLFIISENSNKFDFKNINELVIYLEDNKKIEDNNDKENNNLYFICYCIVNLLFNFVKKYFNNNYDTIDIINKIINILISKPKKKDDSNVPNYMIYVYQQANTFNYIKTYNPINWYDKIFINSINKPKNIKMPDKSKEDIEKCKSCLMNKTNNNICPICNKRIILEKYEHLQYFYYYFYEHLYKFMFDDDVLENYSIKKNII